MSHIVTGAWLVSIFINFIIIFGVTDGQLMEIPTSLYVSFGHTGKRNCCSWR